MKRIFIGLLLALTFLGVESSTTWAVAVPPIQTAVPEPVADVLFTSGKIDEIQNNRIRVKGTGAYEDIIVNKAEGTYVLQAADGSPLAFDQLKKGDSLTAYYTPAVTRSLPPQARAIALIAGAVKTGSPGKYMKAAAVEKNADGSVRVLSSNRDAWVTIPAAFLPPDAAVKAGSELIVWYEIMTMSMPGQTTATKALLLPAKADILVHKGAGVIVAGGRELVLGTGDRIEERQTGLLLPLRVIAESLGYQVVWHDDSKSAELLQGKRTVATVTSGSKICSRYKMTLSLDAVPELVDGHLLVPAEFFTKALQLQVAISDSHI